MRSAMDDSIGMALFLTDFLNDRKPGATIGAADGIRLGIRVTSYYVSTTPRLILHMQK